MLISRTTLYGLIATVLIVVGGAAVSYAAPDGDTKEKSEWVEVTIHMPDGRVIVAKERRHPSRVSAPSGSRAMPRVIPESTEQPSEDQSSLDVDVVDNGVGGGGVSGGLPSHSGSSSSGGGGGGASGGGGGGGGGGSGTTVPVNPNNSGSQNGDDQTEPEADDDTQAPNVTTSDPVPLTVYAWENNTAPFQNISESILLFPRNRSPQQLARLVQQRIQSVNPPKIGLRFWKEFAPATRHPFDDSDPEALIGSGGFRVGLEEYWDQFAIELAALGIEPDYLIHDMEDGVGFWHIPEGRRRWFFDQIMDPGSSVYYQLPGEMRQVTVAQFMDYQDVMGTNALNAYSDFAAEFRARFLTDVFTEAFSSAYGRQIQQSNYGDSIQSFTLIAHTNRPIPTASVTDISSPVVYLDSRPDSGVRYDDSVKEERWNRLIDALNECRSTAAQGEVVPWVAPPGYGVNGPNTWCPETELDAETLFWEMLMTHLTAMGIDTYLLWNPGNRFNRNVELTDPYMDQWVGDHLANGVLLTDLPEIALDADEITTNGVTTTYTEFLQVMGYSDN